MNVERLNRPIDEIVSPDELARHVRVSDAGHIIELMAFAKAATLEIEELAHIALRAQQVRVILDAWPRCLSLRLPIGPVVDWDSVTITADGRAFDDFAVVTGMRPELRAASRPAGRIIVEYSAGFGDSPETIPQDLRLAIMDQAACYFDARGVLDAEDQAQSPHFSRIVGRYRGVRV